jgi:putative ABC transport system ATP-binding protein
VEPDVEEFSMAVASPAIEARELYRFYHIGDDETLALRGVSIAVSPGEIVAVVGPSGSGKSTLLNCLAGLDEPDGGSVFVDGARLTRRGERARARVRAQSIGILLQSGNLFDHLTVEQNIRLKMRFAGQDDGGRVREVLDLVGIAERRHAYPHQLSGGETSRAGLAIALAPNPPILLADEPTGEVDRETEERILALFDERRASGAASLIVSHSDAIAERADRVIHLHDGRVVDE